MSTPAPSPPGQAPRFKDEKHRVAFVEHLRAVHFTLVTTCFLLLLGAALSPSFELASAYREAQQIADRYCRFEALMAGIHVPALQGQIWDNVLSRAPVFVIDSAAFSLNPPEQPTIAGDTTGTFDLHASTRRVSSRRHGITRVVTPDARDKGRPTRCDSNATLTDFATRWDELERYSALMQVYGWDSTGTQVVLTDTSSTLRDRVAPRSGGRAYPVTSRIESAAVVNDHGWTLLLTFADGSAAPPGESPRAPPLRAMRIRLKVDAAGVDRQAAFIDSLNVPWRTGSFAKTFPELFEYYEDIGSLSLKALNVHMQRLRMQERQSIILFGAAIPADSLRAWGMFVLVVIQLYLYVHLAQFKAHWKRFLDDDSPWIGSDGSRVTRLVYEGSLTVLPFVTTLYLTGSAVRYQLSRGQVVVLLACAALSTLLARLSFLLVAREKPLRRDWSAVPFPVPAAGGTAPGEEA